MDKAIIYKYFWQYKFVLYEILINSKYRL